MIGLHLIEDGALGTHPTRWKQKLGYIHMNPVRKGLVREPEHWRYSSANYWVNNGESDLPISSIQVENE